MILISHTQFKKGKRETSEALRECKIKTRRRRGVHRGNAKQYVDNVEGADEREVLARLFPCSPVKI